METIRFKDGRYIKSVVLTKQLILSNTEAPSHFDYGNTDYIVAEVGIIFWSSNLIKKIRK